MAIRALGQNFIRDPRFLGAMMAAAQVRAADIALEVGPGRGVLTALLCRKAGFVVAVEVDRRLAYDLPARLGGPGNLLVVTGDILRLPLDGLAARARAAWAQASGPGVSAEQAPVKVVANLPFYLTAPLLARFEESPALFERLVLMVQSEVAERLLAGPGDPAYGAPSVLLNHLFEIRWVGKVPAKAFHPQPKVDAAVVRLAPWPAPPAAAGRFSDLRFVVQAAFGQRRKTLREAIGRALGSARSGGRRAGRDAAERLLAEAGVLPGRRGETLTLEEFATLSRILPEVLGAKSQDDRRG